MSEQNEKDITVPLYIHLANDLNDQINHGYYRPGDRLPSVRKMAEVRGLSITTILNAYQELENRDVITALPQSGYYVSYKKLNKPLGAKFEISQPKLVDIIDLVKLVLHDSLDESLEQFGAALSPEEILPTDQLNRILKKVLSSKDIKQNVTGSAEGTRVLREQISRQMFLLNTNVSVDEILITSGCNEAIFLALSSICKPGDEVAVESPCYFGVLHILQELKLRVIEIPSDSSVGIDIEKLEFALNNFQIKAVYLNSNCNNPMGCSIPQERKRKIVELTSRFDVPVIEDDSTGELFFGKNRPDILKAYDKKGLVIYCSSFSKILSPTYRVGWILPGKYIDQVTRLKQAINVGTATLQQITIAEYLSSGNYERHLRKVREIYQHRVKQMRSDIFETFPPETFVSNPQGGFNLWIQLPKTVDSFDLYNECKKQHISLTPGAIFTTDGKYDNFIRLSASFYNDDKKHFIKTMGELVDHCSRKDENGKITLEKLMK
ncbi:aminotransferase-like domain-containing protein [Flexilinea flocculi]|jgi:DNA-binding transcriptional MocR family regulator|uniref:DNA-binding transcriptional regulator, MocR family n=1 Tax=Flexilinea flocculi TaxID=1678840 RepID=A0A0K8PBH9_9CHLR|nr:PLP-dependent aminotransferase family protein [Flexilinea flocculi]GAP39874.1 DNA-binding transcriptional regulator, MocR family [Flexilinea flocculi]